MGDKTIEDIVMEARSSLLYRRSRDISSLWNDIGVYCELRNNRGYEEGAMSQYYYIQNQYNLGEKEIMHNVRLYERTQEEVKYKLMGMEE